MKTKQFSTRKLLVLFTAIVSLVAALFLTSCNDKKIVETEILNLPQVLFVDEFDAEMNNIKTVVDNCGIKILVKYDDGTSEEFALTFDMLDDFFQEELNSEGTHYITYAYKGEQIDLEIIVKHNEVFTVRFYDLNNNLISEQQVKKGEAAVEPTEAERAVVGYEFVKWDKTFDKITRSIDVHGEYEKLLTVNFYNSKNVLIETQYVKQGADAQEPADDVKYVPGYRFLRWDSELTNIQADTSIYGVYANDNVTDTDGDGLTDYMEIELLKLDYTKADTDDDGIEDGQEDTDGDGLKNLTEIKNGTKPHNPDTDGDGLTDGDEIDVYWTSPILPDSDEDGATDGWEVANGFDPMEFNASFKVEVSVPLSTETNVELNIPELPAEFIGKEIVELSTDESIQDVHGAFGEVIQYNINAEATITLSSDKLEEAEDPVLMCFNPETKQIEPIALSISGNEATASITTYGSYVLVDRKVFEEKGEWRDVFDGGTFSSLEIVFVVDDSGSMTSNDRNNQRLTVAKDLISNLPDGAKIGIVRFDSSASALTTSLTDSKATAKNYLTTSYFDSNGLTQLYSGAMVGLNLYSNTQENDGVMRVMILLSDGYPEGSDPYTQANVINQANAQGVKIYTVGLGNTESYFSNTLRPIATGTGAEFLYSSNASALQSKFDQIGEKIDMEFDFDEDGLADFFESGVDKNGKPTLPTINNNSFVGLDKTNPDTDNDGYLDGKEIEIYLYYSDTNPNRVMVWGIVHSDPTDASSIPQAS